MKAAHIELMLIVIAQKSAFGQRSLDFSREARGFTESYLARQGQDRLNGLCDIYNHAFGSSAGTSVDGVLLMAASLGQNICGNECAQSTAAKLHAVLHAACESYISDFKQVKLGSSNS